LIASPDDIGKLVYSGGPSSGSHGEAQVICAVCSVPGSICGGYLVEWIRLSEHQVISTSGKAAGKTSAVIAENPVAGSHRIGPYDCQMEGPDDDGLDFIPAAQMHGGRFALA
jgi:hypothetical protein